MKLLSVQQFSLYANGGGSRILRRLYQGHENEVTSLCVVQGNEKATGAIAEKRIFSQPVHKKWMRSYLRKWTTWMRYKVFYLLTLKKLLKEVLQSNATVIHIVDQWNFPAVFINKLLAAVVGKKKIWVSFHDHFCSFNGDKAFSKKLWQAADRRLVISKELGQSYQDLFGAKNFEIITDGVAEAELSLPDEASTIGLQTIYFAGLLHIDYIPLFRILSDALNELSLKGFNFKLILRGTQPLDFLDNKRFQIEYRPHTLDNEVLKKELDEADILYLPIKFTVPEFYLYSLSTKMVGYLAAKGTILYHGPEDSAANFLLLAYNAAISCTSLECNNLIAAIQKLGRSKQSYSLNAKKLVKLQFSLSTIQSRFWKQEKVTLSTAV